MIRIYDVHWCPGEIPFLAALVFIFLLCFPLLLVDLSSFSAWCRFNNAKYPLVICFKQLWNIAMLGINHLYMDHFPYIKLPEVIRQSLFSRWSTPQPRAALHPNSCGSRSAITIQYTYRIIYTYIYNCIHIYTYIHM